VLWNYLFVVIKAIPVMWFTLLLLVVMFLPAELTQVFSSLARATPAELTHVLRLLLLTTIVSVVLALGIESVFLANRRGYVNKFDREIGRRIRRLLEVPTEGDVQVVVSAIRDKHEQQD